MSKKINDCYEYKEAPLRQAMGYASFGWLIGKHSQHYSRKYNREVVTLRRDFIIGADPTIRECEKDYLKLEKGKIPAKYKSHAFFGAVGKFFVIILTIAVLLFGLAQVAVGVYDGLATEKKVRALYNAAIDAGLLSDETVSCDGITDKYAEFVKENPTLDTFSELVAYSKDKVDEDNLLETYKNWLSKFELAETDKEDSFASADPTIEKADGQYLEDENVANIVFDPIRSTFAFLAFDNLFDGMPLWINSGSVFGAAALVVFVLLVIIESAVGKAKKRKKRQRCAELMIECSKKASNALFDLKAEHRELRTRKDANIYELQTMFSKMMDSREEDD
ncbi:MAG: hypothetical protein J5781_05300 [Clostridia bacterium]|nr:hypothetical protein [Clostridia bacterium]